MPSHFQVYLGNLNRVRLSEMIDFYAMQARIDRAKPSLVFQPLTGRCYSYDGIAAPQPSMNGTNG
ncbi:MAG: hypothetical protein HOP09_11020 [Hyphomicrobium sp.]|nr:hypothetical protein [Hyphomicrobium sp.]